jgi:protein Tex
VEICKLNNPSFIKKEQLSELIPELKITKIISAKLSLPLNSVSNTISMLSEGATIPFISRYRKERTGGLDEVVIGKIRDNQLNLIEFHERRFFILKSIADQEKLTQSLLQLFLECESKTEIEDLYLPYKKKRVTRAKKAKDAGLEPLSEYLLGKQNLNSSIEEIAKEFLNPEKKIDSVEKALQGARDIVSEIISDNKPVREKLRKIYWNSGEISSKIITGKENTGIRYKDYYDFDESVSKIPSHRLLAIARGETEEFLRVHVNIEKQQAFSTLSTIFRSPHNSLNEQWNLIYEDCFARLLNPSLESEARRKLKEKSDIEAINIFATNLKELLMSSPLGTKHVLAIDPGFRNGCKVAVLSNSGDFLEYKAIYPHAPRNEQILSKKILSKFIEKYKIDAIAVGNGTAGRETEKLCNDMKKEEIISKNFPVVRVDESGASIYSASKIAREEFPDLDVNVRGAISIGRRLQDPLGELVKVEAKSLGVGQYQHDVDQKELKNSLDDVVLWCVNQVGVELNTASFSILKYISGLGDKLAKSIVSYREQNGAFKGRTELKKVPRLGPKAYEQCAGFLRIRGSKNPLDESAVHPESYKIVQKMAKDLNYSVKDLIGNSKLISSIDIKKYITEKIGEFTLNDILSELLKPGRDPRDKFEQVIFREDVQEFSDLKEEMVLQGVITNVTAFGAFVDVGVHQDGLVHISELSHTFVKDPLQVVKPGQKVTVKVMSLDSQRKRISLSIKACLAAPSGSDNFHKKQYSQNKPAQKHNTHHKQNKPTHNQTHKKSQNSSREQNPFEKFFKK